VILFIYVLLYSTSPSRQVKEKYARGIVSLFPYLSDPLSKKGYVRIIILLLF